jgi:hypothetical protein
LLAHIQRAWFFKPWRGIQQLVSWNHSFLWAICFNLVDNVILDQIVTHQTWVKIAKPTETGNVPFGNSKLVFCDIGVELFKFGCDKCSILDFVKGLCGTKSHYNDMASLSILAGIHVAQIA